jgi:type 1 glutamine amidotransferase
MKRSILIVIPLLFVLNTCVAQQESGAHILVFSKTDGFRHASIADGVKALREIGEENGYTVDHTEDATLFNTGNLERYDAIVFLNTPENVLNEMQQEAFKQFIHVGGGFVGSHADSDTDCYPDRHRRPHGDGNSHGTALART